MVVSHTRHKTMCVVGWSVGSPLLQKDDLEIYLYIHMITLRLIPCFGRYE